MNTAFNIVYVNPGASVTGLVPVAEGTTFGQFLDSQMGEGFSSKNFKLLLNQQGNISRDTLLKAGDIVSVTPLKMEGAH